MVLSSIILEHRWHTRSISESTTFSDTSDASHKTQNAAGTITSCNLGRVGSHECAELMGIHALELPWAGNRPGGSWEHVGALARTVVAGAERAVTRCSNAISRHRPTECLIVTGNRKSSVPELPAHTCVKLRRSVLPECTASQRTGSCARLIVEDASGSNIL